MKRIRETISIILAAALFVLLCFAAANLLIPYRYDYGVDWKDYLDEEENTSDVLFFGSSIVYCDIIPSVIYDSTGISSYVVAGPEQTVPISYYYIREALKTQSPQAVVLELTGMFFDKYQNFTQANISYMPIGLNRLGAILNAAEPERIAGLLFPILDYHDRWYSIEKYELEDNLHHVDDGEAGYTFLSDSKPRDKLGERECADDGAYEYALKYLRKISELCEERGIKLILYISPEMTRIPEAELAKLRADLEDIAYYSFTDYNEEVLFSSLGIDNSTDWFDFLHFNFRGAVKLSSAMAELISSCSVTPSGSSSDELWAERSTLLANKISAY